jgi:pimeloyl-ACP methyl ester carboxylesterase
MASSELQTRSIPLPTGVTLNVRLGGKADGEPILFLHGFPESHRTWRHQLDALSADHFVIAPDQRGFGASDRPEGVEAYETRHILADLWALADALKLGRFTLAGHDWGGAVAWAAAMAEPARLSRLVIVNAPHPLIFQKSLIEDEGQRAASQYINAFRSPLAEAGIQAMGLETFLEKVLLAEGGKDRLAPAERQACLDDWARPGALTAMLNWYRAATIVVPAPGEVTQAPAWTKAPFPRLTMPILVIWGLKDRALLPIQLAGLHALADNLRLVTAPVGHFVPWQEPELVTGAIRDFFAETRAPFP